MRQYVLRADVLDAWKRLTGRSDAEIARLARIPAASLSRWRNEKRPIHLKAAEALSDVTGIPRDRLIERIEDAPASRSGAERRVDAALGSVLRGTPKADAKAAS